jgi:hypothetical protein
MPCNIKAAAARRSSRGLCTCSTDTARLPSGWAADTRGRSGHDRADSICCTLFPRSACSDASPDRNNRRRRPRRRTPSHIDPKVELKAPGLGRLVFAGCCTRRRAAAGRQPPQPRTSLFASDFPPEKRTDFHPEPARPGERHRGMPPALPFSIGRLSGRSCTILNKTTTASPGPIPQPCRFATIGIN